jgi:hypothetical protein
MPNERTHLRNVVSTYLRTLGPNVFFEKRWGGGIYTTPGAADYVGCAYAFPTAIEIKNPDGTGLRSVDQILWAKRWINAGGEYLQATSLGQVREFLEKLRRKRGGA